MVGARDETTRGSLTPISRGENIFRPDVYAAIIINVYLRAFAIMLTHQLVALMPPKQRQPENSIPTSTLETNLDLQNLNTNISSPGDGDNACVKRAYMKFAIGSQQRL